MIASSCSAGRSGSSSGANDTIVSSALRSLRTMSSAPNRLVSGSQSSRSSASWMRAAASRCGVGSAPTIAAISARAWVDHRWIALNSGPAIRNGTCSRSWPSS